MRRQEQTGLTDSACSFCFVTSARLLPASTYPSILPHPHYYPPCLTPIPFLPFHYAETRHGHYSNASAHHYPIDSVSSSIILGVVGGTGGGQAGMGTWHRQWGQAGRQEQTWQNTTIRAARGVAARGWTRARARAEHLAPRTHIAGWCLTRRTCRALL